LASSFQNAAVPVRASSSAFYRAPTQVSDMAALGQLRTLAAHVSLHSVRGCGDGLKRGPTAADCQWIVAAAGRVFRSCAYDAVRIADVMKAPVRKALY
jgi:hypothetical protein